jgi:hypothetical protein
MHGSPFLRVFQSRVVRSNFRLWQARERFGETLGRCDGKREKAAELRREAEEKLASAARREVAARQESDAADRERQAAEQAMEQADAVYADAPATPTTASSENQ